jgi:predicted transcriptional regulator
VSVTSCTTGSVTSTASRPSTRPSPCSDKEEALALIVDKRDDDDEYGIVLLSDIAKKVLAANRAPERTNVYEIMSKPVLGVHPDMQVRYCARLFNAFGLTLAPVIDAANEVLGMVSYDDLVLRGLSHR